MSARRTARASASRIANAGIVGKPPPELLDGASPLWQDRTRYAAWMKRREWGLPAGDRAGGGTYPSNRRSYAAAAWAVEKGVFLEANGRSADWHQLRRAGLIA